MTAHSVRIRSRRPATAPALMLFALLAALWLLPGSAGASIVTPMTVEELHAVAEDVVHGTVVSQETAMANGVIYTLTDIEVQESFKGRRGSAGETTTVVTPGGRMGKIGMISPGAPNFEVDEQVVLFLSNPGARIARDSRSQGRVNEESPFVRYPQVVGGYQGKFRVVSAEVEHETPNGRTITSEVSRIFRETPGRRAALRDYPSVDQFTTQLRQMNDRISRGRTANRVVPTVGELPVAERDPDASALRFFDFGPRRTTAVSAAPAPADPTAPDTEEAANDSAEAPAAADEQAAAGQ